MTLDEPEQVAREITMLERQLLLGEGQWGSWMFEVDADLVAKGIGRRDSRGSIYFDTPLGNAVIAALRSHAQMKEDGR